MNKKIKSALISVFYKDGLEPILRALQANDVTIYSTGGTQSFIEGLGISCIAVETITSYPSILDGRVKTLHPSVFGGILGKRDDVVHVEEMQKYNIPEIDLVIVDLYPFEETVRSTTDEKSIIEKIDIGGPSMIRAAGKNFKDVMVVAAKKDYLEVQQLLEAQHAETTLEQRRAFAVKAFDVCTNYDIAISNYFNKSDFKNPFGAKQTVLRYGENPHQQAVYYGDLEDVFEQLNGKELSYNNLVDVDAAVNLMHDLETLNKEDVANKDVYFAIIKHTNVCGVSARNNVHSAWEAALESDPESAFGGVLITNAAVDSQTANAINEIFFEVLIAPSFHDDALQLLKSKKNRIVLKENKKVSQNRQTKSLLNGTLTQQNDEGNYLEWKEVGGRETTSDEKSELKFANIICKHLKSNAIALVKNNQLVGKGCGQTSRIDSLKQAIEKAKQFKFNLAGALLASDAFFPFDDCVKIAFDNGVSAFIQPGGSIRDKDSIEFCKQNNLAMVITGMRHFRH